MVTRPEEDYDAKTAVRRRLVVGGRRGDTDGMHGRSDKTIREGASACHRIGFAFIL